MARWLCIVLVILILRFIVNSYKYLLTRHYMQKYESYLEEPARGIEQDKHQITKLFNDAGVKDCSIPNIQSVGPGHVLTSQASAWDNLGLRRNDVVSYIRGMFQQSLGVYRTRMIETVNPIYWIEVIVSLPKVVLGYLGVSPESGLTKFAQILYWAGAGAVGFLYALYKAQIDIFVRDWIDRLLH